MKTYKWNREIWLDLDNIDLGEFNKTLAPHGVQVEYNLPGLTFYYNDTLLNLKLVPCDISFYSKTGILKLNIVEGFGNLEFYTEDLTRSNSVEEYTDEDIEKIRAELIFAKSINEETDDIEVLVKKEIERRKERIKNLPEPGKPEFILPIIDL